MRQLQKICQKVNVPCPKTKRNAIQKLLNPLKMKYKMINENNIGPVDLQQVNKKMLKKLAEFRQQKENEKATKIQKRFRGYLSRKKTMEIKKKCHKEIKNFLRTRKSIDRDKKLYQKNPTTLRKKTLQIIKNKMKDCLQDKNSSNVRP